MYSGLKVSLGKSIIFASSKVTNRRKDKIDVVHNKSGQV